MVCNRYAREYSDTADKTAGVSSLTDLASLGKKILLATQLAVEEHKACDAAVAEFGISVSSERFAQ